VPRGRSLTRSRSPASERRYRHPTGPCLCGSAAPRAWPVILSRPWRTQNDISGVEQRAYRKGTAGGDRHPRPTGAGGTLLPYPISLRVAVRAAARFFRSARCLGYARLCVGTAPVKWTREPCECSNTTRSASDCGDMQPRPSARSWRNGSARPRPRRRCARCSPRPRRRGRSWRRAAARHWVGCTTSEPSSPMPLAAGRSRRWTCSKSRTRCMPRAGCARSC